MIVRERQTTGVSVRELTGASGPKGRPDVSPGRSPGKAKSTRKETPNGAAQMSSASILRPPRWGLFPIWSQFPAVRPGLSYRRPFGPEDETEYATRIRSLQIEHAGNLYVLP